MYSMGEKGMSNIIDITHIINADKEATIDETIENIKAQDFNLFVAIGFNKDGKLKIVSTTEDFEELALLGILLQQAVARVYFGGEE